MAYNLLTRRIPEPVPTEEKQQPLHRHHYKAIAAPFVTFPLLYLLPWNPIYPAIVAMFIGALANVLCRPDLKRKSWIGGLLFLIYYALFLAILEWSAPGYIDRVWNMAALSGISVGFMPLKEIGFGMYWAGVYEHLTWKNDACAPPEGREWRGVAMFTIYGPGVTDPVPLKKLFVRPTVTKTAAVAPKQAIKTGGQSPGSSSPESVYRSAAVRRACTVLMITPRCRWIR